MDFELSPNIKIQVVQQELTQLEADMYRLGLRYAVREKLGKKQEAEAIAGDMEELQGFIEYYRGELDAVMAEVAKVADTSDPGVD